MKAKHTFEYALLCAKLESNQLDQELTPLELTLFATGYMKAIEETAAPELLEALIELEKLTFSLNVEVDGLTALALQCCRERVTSAIKKAIGE